MSDEGETVGLTDEEAEESLRALDKITVMIGASYMVTRVEKGKRGEGFRNPCEEDCGLPSHPGFSGPSGQR